MITVYFVDFFNFFDLETFYSSSTKYHKNTQQETELQRISIYIDYVLSLNELKNDDNKDDEKTDISLITSLYFPIPSHLKNDAHSILLSLCDGVILCKLINIIQCRNCCEELIDSRVIHYPDVFNPEPISDNQLLDNFQLLLSVGKVISIPLDSYNAKYILKDNPSLLPKLIIDFVNGLSSIYLSNRININKYHELVRLVKNNEDTSIIRMMNGQQWLQRWINYHNGNRVLSEINCNDFNVELFNAMNIKSSSKKSMNDNDDNDNYEKIMVEKLLQFANEKILTDKDLLSHNRMIQDLFAANLFEAKRGCWNKLSKDEKISYKQQIKSASKNNIYNKENGDIQIFIQWINSVLSTDESLKPITSIKDLRSGYYILKILDLTKPGCVEWKSVRTNNEIRHKFDKINNCNILKKVCDESFGFSLVGYAGSDIADGNFKVIQSLLLQLMRCYSTSKLSKLLSLSSKQSVSDCDILQWANLTINECQYAKSKSLTSLKDNALSTGIFYVELLKAIKPKHVDLSVIYYDIKPKSINNQSNSFIDRHQKHRISNASYAISMIRRFGGEIFVTPTDLCNIEYKSVLSVFASIMTIAMFDAQNDNDPNQIYYE